MILKIHIQSLLDPFQDSKFYSRWQPHENAKQIYPIQFLQVVHDNGLFVEYHTDGLLYFFKNMTGAG